MISPNETNGQENHPFKDLAKPVSIELEMTFEVTPEFIAWFDSIPKGPGPYGRGDEPK